MPAYDAAISAFNGGEWSGRMRGRSDLEAYRRALSYMENWEPFAQGSMRRRPGTKFLRDMTGPLVVGNDRLATLRTARAGDFGIYLGEEQIQVFEADGSQAENGVIETVLNGDFSKAGAYWTASGISYVFQAGVAGFYPGGTLETNFFRQSVGPFTAANLVFSMNSGCYLAGAQMEVRLGSTLGGTDLAVQSVVVGSPTSISISSFTGTVYISIHILTPSSGTVPFGATPFGTVPFAWVDDVSLKPAVVTPVQFVTPWLSGDLSEVQWAEDTGADRLIFVHPKYEPRILNRTAAGVWAFNTPTWTSKPASWTGSNWPSVVEVYQGRLWMAAPPDAPTTFWGSKSGSGNFFDFTIGTNPGDAFSYIAATKNALRWLRGHRVMMMGAVNAELAVTAASVIVGPGDVDVREESAYGSAPSMALKAGQEVLYISGDRQKIRSIRYDFQSAGWVSDDITDFAEHLFLDGIDELHWGRDPNNALIAVLSSGEMRVCTYSPGQKVLAWWRWTTPGIVRSATIIYREGGAKIWLLVDRNGSQLLEEQPLGEPRDVQYFDAHESAVVNIDPDGNPYAAGFFHLSNQTVKVLLDGAVEPDAVVDPDVGMVMLAREGSIATVGLGFANRAKTLSPEGGNPAGTSQGMNKRWSDVVVRLNNSALPTVNGRRPANQRAVSTPLDSPEPLFTGDVVLTNPRGDTDGSLVIEQDLPLRTEVCAIFGTVQQNKV